MNILKLIIGLTLVFVGSLNAQTKNDPDSVIIEGIIIDSLLALNPEKEIEVRLFVSGLPSSYTIFEKHFVSTRNNKQFKFTVNSPSERFYFRIVIQNVNQNTYADDIFIVDKGDRIQFKYLNGTFHFSGKGSAKLQCHSELYKFKERFIKAPTSENENDWRQYYNYQYKQVDSIYKLRMAVVNRYAPTLGEKLTEIMKVNCFGLKYFVSFRTMPIYMKYPNKIDGFLGSDFFKNTALDSIEINDPGTLVNSPVFCDFVYSRIYLESIQLKNGRYESNKNSIFNNIIQNYTGEVREKLLVLFFYRNKSYGTMDYLDKALDVVTKPEYRNILSRLEKTSSKGVPFFPFELEDSQGKIVALKDFKGKIIILDFWYTGCGNCIILNNAMKPVVEKFKNNPNVLFISVSVDKDKSKWLQSLCEGKYTHPESINLYAGVDKMRRHPLVNAYNISGYPRVFVLKDEKMHEANPPDARFDKGFKMIELINAALKNKTN